MVVVVLVVVKVVVKGRVVVRVVGVVVVVAVVVVVVVVVVKRVGSKVVVALSTVAAKGHLWPPKQQGSWHRKPMPPAISNPLTEKAGK